MCAAQVLLDFWYNQRNMADLIENNFSVSLRPAVYRSSKAPDWITSTPCACWHFIWLGCAEVLCLLLQQLQVRRYSCFALSRRYCLPVVTYCLWLLHFLHLLTTKIPEPRGKCALHMHMHAFHLNRKCHSPFPYSLHPGELWFSLLIVI